MESSEKPKERLSVVISVLSRRMNATEGAKTLGVSRKTYYEWEGRALDAMQEALTDRQVGRPQTVVDEEKEALRKENERLQTELELAKKTIAVKTILTDFVQQQKSLLKGLAAKPGKKKRMRKKQ